MDVDTVKVVNNCEDSITVFLRYTRPKRGSDGRPKSFSLKPGQESRPLPRRLLTGAAGWNELQRRHCVSVQRVTFDPRYIRLLNESSEAIDLVVRVAKPEAAPSLSTLTLKPRKKSRIVDVTTIKERKRLEKLVAAKRLSVLPVFEIGPAGRGGRSAGWYDGESVYTCYDCGGAIVFRGNPPTPVHI